ncbi:COG2 [Scenedesmus sp. PABB004]|nr:COG2 [Scenedesmus sp. PABB004]
MAPAAAAGGEGEPARAEQQRVPTWLRPEQFEALDFSPDLCVADLRRYVPLPTVKAELQKYLQHLKNKLVEAINEDYGDYVGLAARLGGLEGGVLRMRTPLTDIAEQLSAVQEGIRAELAELQQGLQRRQDAAAARATLELMQEVAASTGKVEKLLEEVAAQQAQQAQPQQAGASAFAGASGSAGGAVPPPPTDPEELLAHCRMLERVAGEAARLLYLTERGKGLAFVKALERRVASCRMALDRQLQAALLAALGAAAWPAATHCLRGYLELGEPGRGEEGLRAGLVGPLVRGVVGEVRQSQLAAGGGAGSGGAPGGGGPLAAVVAQSLERLQGDAAPLLATLAAPGSGLGGLDLLGAVLLAEVSQAVADGMPGAAGARGSGGSGGRRARQLQPRLCPTVPPRRHRAAGVFSPGNPAAFHANFLAGQGLLAALEGLATSRAAVERLRGSAAAAGWAKRWNLPVYFSLVYQDIAGTFEAAAKASSLAPAPPGAPAGLRLAVSAALAAALQRALSPDLFLLQLADKFGKLTMQLLVRYDSWLLDVAAAREAGAAAAAEAAAAGAPQPPGAAQPAGGAPGADAADAGATGPAAWAASMPAEECAVICSDADALQRLVTGPLTQQLEGLLAGLPAEAVAPVTGALQRLAARIAEHGQQVLLLVGGDVLERCMAMVRQLKGITATYRMTAKGPPVRHSHYVAGVLQPLRQLLDAPGPVAALPERLKLALAADVVERVNARYAALAEELLATVRKTESSLKRLKKARPGEPPDGAAGAPGGGMSDSDKIGLQLFLDVEEHGRQVARFGLDPEALDAFRRLRATVAPAEAPPGGAAPGAAAAAAPAPGGALPAGAGGVAVGGAGAGGGGGDERQRPAPAAALAPEQG